MDLLKFIHGCAWQYFMKNYIKINHKCAEIRTKPQNILVKLHKEKCAYKKLYGKMPDNEKYLRDFKEMGVVRNTNMV